MSGHEDGGLPDGVVLRLQPGVSFQLHGGQLVSLCSTETIYAFEDDDAAVLARCLPVLDGSRSLAEASAEVGLPTDAVRVGALALYSAGLLAEDSDVAIDPLVFYDHARAAALLWSETALPAPRLGAGGREEIGVWLTRGPLIEHWQYVRTAPARLSLAARLADLGSARGIWLELAAEEEAWAQELETGLRQALGAGVLARARPLPGTAALCDQMEAAAREHQLGYAACLAAGFASEESSAGLLTHYRQLDGLGVVPVAVVGPFLRYAERTAERARSDPLRIIFAAQPPLLLAERRTVLGHLADHVEALGAYHRDVLALLATHDPLKLSPPAVSAGLARTSRGLLRKVKDLWTALRTYQRGSSHSSRRVSE